ncbi:neuroguidin isoform X2 [Spatholobus suberectus]|nr:neuroguidin isoform X2 [Spatholobus suberectus]
MQASEHATRNDIQSKEPVAFNKSEDTSKYHPNPDILVIKLDLTSQDGNDSYQPVKFAPTSMDLVWMARTSSVAPDFLIFLLLLLVKSLKNTLSLTLCFSPDEALTPQIAAKLERDGRSGE